MILPLAYPTTPHLRGSRGSNDDLFLDAETTRRVLASTTVVQEKLDGVNVGLRWRGRVLDVAIKDREASRDERASLAPLTHRLASKAPQLQGLQLFGEFVNGAWFLFDVVDESRQRLLGHEAVAELAVRLEVSTAQVLHVGALTSLRAVERLLELPSQVSKGRMEGVVLRVERHGFVSERFKFVRADFQQVQRHVARA